MFWPCFHNNFGKCKWEKGSIPTFIWLRNTLPSCQSIPLFFSLCSFSLLFFANLFSSHSTSPPPLHLSFTLHPHPSTFSPFSLSPLFHFIYSWMQTFSLSLPFLLSAPPPLPPLLLHPSLVRSLTQLSHSWSIPVGLAFSILRLCRGHSPPTVTVAGTNGRQRKVYVCVCVCYPLTLFHHHPPPPPTSHPSTIVLSFHHSQLPSILTPPVSWHRETLHVLADAQINSNVSTYFNKLYNSQGLLWYFLFK